ncbi:MAG: TIM barrel protein [Candidatus Aenigmarchaeota archaeon]|nr:TIM barrel protein [Candidatus Aenigmarchaeota archaeon]
MQKIFLGPAGIPTTTKGGTLEGIKEVSRLGLNSIECEFVRGVRMKPELAREVGDLAKKLNIQLTIHAPYFINLCSKDKKTIEASKKMILDSADRGELMNAKAIAIHSAYYTGLNSKQALEKTKEGFMDILDKMKSEGIKNVKLGIETMARESQFGTLDETIELCKEARQLIPYIDWAHLFARNNGKIDYGEVFDKLKILKSDRIYSHFEGVKFDEKKKRFVDVHVPINSHPPFEPLAREILKRKIDITVISESPLLEHDSLKMKNIFEKLGYKFSE